MIPTADGCCPGADGPLPQEFEAEVAGPPTHRRVALVGHFDPVAAHRLRRLIWAEALRRGPAVAALELDFGRVRACSAAALALLVEGLRMLRQRRWRLLLTGLAGRDAAQLGSLLHREGEPRLAAELELAAVAPVRGG